MRKKAEKFKSKKIQNNNKWMIVVTVNDVCVRDVCGGWERKKKNKETKKQSKKEKTDKQR